jgi:hypothetical protein
VRKGRGRRRDDMNKRENKQESEKMQSNVNQNKI